MADEETTPQPGPAASLTEAFSKSAASPEQESASSTQEQPGTGESTQQAPSRNEDGTQTSRTTEDTTKEDPLAEVSIDAIKSHPTLSKAFQSAVDSGVAAAMRGKTAEIETRVRSELTLSEAQKRFDAMAPEELGRTLSEDPDAKKLYTAIQTRPTPPPPEQTAAITAIAKTVEFYDRKLQAAGLPKETLDKLTPANWLPNQSGTADEILERWTTEIDKAVVDFTVTKELAKSGKTLDDSKELDAQAERDAGRRGPVMTNGTKTTPPIDLTKAAGKSNLYEAFARQEGVRR